ncbi:MAG: xanthine dehydrogenase accessory factor [Chloroflexota bacterium]|jgi:xanthine dehydrogenase accessory factor|nr:xanthine dehydrogenase accessory factor [Chloroflexota bacterium]
MSLAGDVLDRAAGLRERGETFVVATVVRVDPPTSARPGDKALIAADGTLWGWIGGSCSESLVRREALHAMGDGQPRLVKIAPDMAPEHEPGVVAHVSTCPSAGSLDVFIDPHLPRPVLLVIGDTPAAHTLVRLGATIGYETCAVHPGAVASDFPDADRVIGSLDLAPAKPGATTWAVVATMGHYDEEAIEALLPHQVAYIGLVASRKRAATVLAVLTVRGTLGLDRVRRAADGSVGGSQEEIALAVLAEIVAERQARQPSYTMALPATAIDPICGMSVEIKGALHTLVLGETTYYFCGAGCLDAFRQREGQAMLARPPRNDA